MKTLLITLMLIAALGISVSCAVNMGGISVTQDDKSGEAEAQGDDGVIVDEEEGIIAGMTLDENLDEESPAVVFGDTQWVAGIDGTAMEFDAEGEYILLPDSPELDLTDQGTVEVWVYPYSNIAAAGIVHKGVELDYSDEAYSLQYNNPGQVAFIITNEEGTATYVISNDGEIATGQWHHIVAAWDADDVYLYIDGNPVESRSIYSNGWLTGLPEGFSPAQATDGDLMVGSQIPYSYRFDGIIDNVFLYDRVLGPAEVSAHYSELVPM